MQVLVGIVPELNLMGFWGGGNLQKKANKPNKKSAPGGALDMRNMLLLRGGLEIFDGLALQEPGSGNNLS